MLNVKQCLLLSALVRLGSLGQVAAEMRVSTPALSRQLAALEADCGGALFHRHGRGLAPTELCERLLPAVQRLLDDFHDLELIVRDMGKDVRGTVRLGILPAGSGSLLVGLIEALRESHPMIQLQISDGSSGQLEEGLRAGTLDLSFTTRINAISNEAERILARNPLQLFAPPDFPLPPGDTIEFSALSDIPLILPQMPNTLRGVIDSHAKELCFSLIAAFEVNSLICQLELLGAGLACYIGARGTVPMNEPNAEEPGHERRLAVRTIINPAMESCVVLARTSRHPLTRASRTVMDIATAVTHKLQGSGIWRLP